MKLIPFTLLAVLSLVTAAVPVPPVILTEQGVRNLGIETVAVEEADFETTVFALGRTEAIPEQRAILSSRIPGRVAEHLLRFGKQVKKDEPLLLLESRQPGDPPPSVWLKAPASGTIISVATKLGSPVEPSDQLAEIANLSTLYLIVTLPQATAGKIPQGTQAKLHFPLRPGKEYRATLLQNSPYLCPDAICNLGIDVSKQSAPSEAADLNTAAVIFTIENPENVLRPEMNAECRIIMEKRSDVLSIPRASLQGSAGNRHVYIKHMTISHAFDRVPVQTGMISEDRVEIIDGLLPGDEVVTRGAYSLGYAGKGAGPSLKEAMDAAHGHEHNEDGSEKKPDQTQGTADHHEHTTRGPQFREMFFMTSTGILALLLVLTSLRRRAPDLATTELS